MEVCLRNMHDGRRVQMEVDEHELCKDVYRRAAVKFRVGEGSFDLCFDSTVEGDALPFDDTEVGQTRLGADSALVVCEKPVHRAIRLLRDEEGVRNIDQRALCTAAATGNTRAIGLLVTTGIVDVNALGRAFWASASRSTTFSAASADTISLITPLAWAARCGKAEAIETLLLHGAKVNTPDRTGCTPLGWASRRCFPEVVAVLLQHGALLDAGSKSPLIYAAVQEDAEIVSLLLGHGADPGARDKADGSTALHHAARALSITCTAVLLDAGTPVDALDNSRKTPLHWACSVPDSVDMVGFLLRHGASATRSAAGQRTPLHMAAGTADPEPTRFRLLLDAGADVNAQDSSMRTPLLVATRMEQVDVCFLLLAAGADVTVSDNASVTALHHACRYYQERLALKYLELGATAHCPAVDGTTPLSWACQFGTPDLVSALIAAGADPRQKGILINAVRNHMTDIVRTLLQHGADPTAVKSFAKTYSLPCELRRVLEDASPEEPS